MGKIKLFLKNIWNIIKPYILQIVSVIVLIIGALSFLSRSKKSVTSLIDSVSGGVGKPDNEVKKEIKKETKEVKKEVKEIEKKVDEIKEERKEAIPEREERIKKAKKYIPDL